MAEAEFFPLLLVQVNDQFCSCPGVQQRVLGHSVWNLGSGSFYLDFRLEIWRPVNCLRLFDIC